MQLERCDNITDMKMLFFIPMSTVVFPYGIAYLCPPLIKMGVTPEILFPANEGMSDAELFQKFKTEKYDIIGMGGMYPSLRYIMRVCEMIRTASPGTVILLGGPLVTATPEFVLKKTGADIGAINESELSICNIISAVKDGAPLSQVRGIVYRESDGQIHTTGPAPFVDNLDDLEPIPWHLFPMEYFIKNTYRGLHREVPDHLRSFAFLGSRSCPFSCNFCYRPQKYRSHSVDRILDEIQFLMDEYRVEYFGMTDNLCFTGRKKIEEWAGKIQDRGMKFNYSVNLRLDKTDQESLNALHDTGCIMIEYGLESGSQRILDTIGKKTKVEDFENIFRMTRKAGILVCCSAMFGQPGDDEESLSETLAYILKWTDISLGLNVCTPYPGSRLYQYAIDNGYLKDEEDFFNKFHDVTYLSVNFTKYSDYEFYRLLDKANKLISSAHERNAILGGRMALSEIDASPAPFLRHYVDFQRTLEAFLKGISETGASSVALYGMGALAELVLICSQKTDVHVTSLFDGSPEKQGNEYFGMKIEPPEQLGGGKWDAILITAALSDYDLQIRASIRDNLQDRNMKIISVAEELSKIR